MQSNRGAFDTQEERDILFLTLKWSAFMTDKSTHRSLPASPFPSKPSATSSIAWKKSALEFDSGGFEPGTSGYPGFRLPHLKRYRTSHLLVPETTRHCLQRSFFLACLANRYLLPQNYI